MNQIILPKINEIIYDKPRSNFVLGGEESLSYLIDTEEIEVEGVGKKLTPKIKYVENQGVLTYYKGVSYPAKGAQTPEAMKALNQIKRILISVAKLCKNPLFLIGLYLVRKPAMEYFNEVFDKTMGEHSIKREYLCGGAFAVERFLEAVTGNRQFAHNIAQIPEYDDAYRYRLQDIFTELNVLEFRKNPIKEFDRLVKLYISRERMGVYYKTKNIIRLAKLALCIPSFRRKVCDNINHLLNFGWFDESDKYWVSIIDNGYDYFGMSIDDRLKLYEERPYAYRITT